MARVRVTRALAVGAAFYCLATFLKRLDNWQKNNWRGSDKKEVKNRDLWEELVRLTTLHNVTFHKVKGHADNELNNRCDLLATTAIKEFQKASTGENL